MNYAVTWEIDIEADTPHEAAKKAREIQLRQDSIATVFIVKEGGHRARTVSGEQCIDLTLDGDL